MFFRLLTWLPKRGSVRQPIRRPATLRLDLYKHTGRNLNTIDCLNRSCSWFADIDDAFVRSHFKLLAGLLIDVGTTQDRVPLDSRGERNGTVDLCACAFGLLDDLLR